jgi:hypothetical protein
MWKYTIMKLVNFFFLAMLLFIANVDAQTVFTDYKMVKNPIGDPNIIGKQAIDGIFIGSGAATFRTDLGLESLFQGDTTGLRSKFEIEVSKVVSGNIGLSSGRAATSNFSNIRILTCTDFSEIPFISGRGLYVVGAITVGSFEVSLDRVFDTGLQAELDEKIAQKFNIVPEITYTGNKAKVSLGKDLIVATKLIKITNTTFYIDKPSIASGNRIEYTDELLNSDNSLKFESMVDMDITTFTTPVSIEKNKGVFLLRMTASVLQDPTGNSALSRALIVAPTLSEMTGTLKPDPSIYSPTSDFQNISMKRILHGYTTKFVVTYSVSIENLKVTYNREPLSNNTLSNFLIDKVTADLKIRKNVYYYKIIK